jgi:hypothetical protein
MALANVVVQCCIFFSDDQTFHGVLKIGHGVFGFSLEELTDEKMAAIGLAWDRFRYDETEFITETTCLNLRISGKDTELTKEEYPLLLKIVVEFLVSWRSTIKRLKRNCETMDQIRRDISSDKGFVSLDDGRLIVESVQQLTKKECLVLNQKKFGCRISFA